MVVGLGLSGVTVGFRYVIGSLLVFFAAFPGLGNVQAQDANFPAMTPALLQQTLAQYGIPQNSEAMQRVLLNIQKWDERSARIERGEEVEDAQPNLTESPAGPIVLHLRASFGPRFPSLEEVKQEIMTKVLQLTPEHVETAIQHVSENFVSGVKKIHELRSLPRCAKPLTTMTPRGFRMPQVVNETYFDSLFVRREDVPLDPKEVFGNSVSIRLYDEKHPSQSSYSAMAYKVTCLPYRIRVTGVGTYIHQGEHALRNYDTAPNGRGVQILRANFNRRGAQ